MEGEYLIDCNRASLKIIFYKSLAEKESQHISFHQFLKFCSCTKIYPDLISSSEIKRIVSGVLKKSISEEKSIELFYLHFEKIFKSIAEYSFPSGNSIKLLISHIKNQCILNYNAILTTITPIKSIYESSSTSNLISKPLNSNRIKSNSVRRRKIMSNSTLHKESSSKVELLFTPRDQTMLSPKLLENRSPRLKIINIKNKIHDDKKINKIKNILDRFHRTHKKITKNKKAKQIFVKFVEKYIENKCRIVKFMQDWIFLVVFQIWKIKAKII